MNQIAEMMAASTIADRYAKLSIDLCYAGAEFAKAARHLDAKRFALAEIAIQNGLDRLSVAVLEVPVSTDMEEQHNV